MRGALNSQLNAMFSGAPASGRRIDRIETAHLYRPRRSELSISRRTLER